MMSGFEQDLFLLVRVTGGERFQGQINCSVRNTALIRYVRQLSWRLIKLKTKLKVQQ
jgi:hypothetical protein